MKVTSIHNLSAIPVGSQQVNLHDVVQSKYKQVEARRPPKKKGEENVWCNGRENKRWAVKSAEGAILVTFHSVSDTSRCWPNFINTSNFCFQRLFDRERYLATARINSSCHFVLAFVSILSGPTTVLAFIHKCLIAYSVIELLSP